MTETMTTIRQSNSAFESGRFASATQRERLGLTTKTFGYLLLL